MRKITALLAVVAVVGCKDSKVAVDLQGVPPATQSQRYQIVINSHYKDDPNHAAAFLIDTQTGRVWGYKRFFIDASGDRTAQHFLPIEVLDENGIMGLTPSAFYELNEKANEKVNPTRRAREETALKTE